jgi:hypothetical protein
MVLGFIYKHYLILQTDKSIIGEKKTTKGKPHKKHGQFPTCHLLIMESNNKWLQEESSGFLKRHFGLFHGNLAVKRDPSILRKQIFSDSILLKTKHCINLHFP